MTNKTAAQIEAMKNDFTFGVEIEMNHISRDTAAYLAAEFFGTGRYNNTANRNGYCTWSAWDADDREWKFQRDVSIAGPDNQKCELVTPILTWSDIETLQELVRRLRKAGAVSNPSQGCGVHIHVARIAGFSVKDIKNLVNMMAAHEEQIGRAIRIDAGRTSHYCQVIDPKFLEAMNRKNPRTMDQLEDIWYSSQGCNYGRSHHYNDSRYHMLNLHSFFNGHGTVEFRLFQFANPANGKKNGLHAGELKSYIQLCLGMCQLATMLRSASPKPQQTENEKYALRCWLLRLGFIGDEFATAREILLRNMDGCSAWRKAC